MESEKIFEILYNFEEDKNELVLLEELKKIYAEEIKCSFEAPDDERKNKKVKFFVISLIFNLILQKFRDSNNNPTLTINGETVNKFLFFNFFR